MPLQVASVITIVLPTAYIHSLFAHHCCPRHHQAIFPCHPHHEWIPMAILCSLVFLQDMQWLVGSVFTSRVVGKRWAQVSQSRVFCRKRTLLLLRSSIDKEEGCHGCLCPSTTTVGCSGECSVEWYYIMYYIRKKRISRIKCKAAANRKCRQRRSWYHFRNSMTPSQFRQYFRMSKECFELLCDKIKDNLGHL